MSLKQQVVVVNQYTIKNAATGKGSRGSTPGQYVTRYMARDQATQTLAPIRKAEMDAFIMRYMARASAVESLSTDAGADLPRRARRKVDSAQLTPAEIRWRAKAAGLEDLDRGEGDADTTGEPVEVEDLPAPPQQTVDPAGGSVVTSDEVKQVFRNAQKLGGIGFGYGSVSLSHDELTAASDQVQELFEQGKTVMKTVVSFRHDFLVEHGIVREDLKVRRPGDYRGEIDELKLRLGVMTGVEKMARHCYDDLRYVGVIQVDTKHVHAHLVMVDAGVGTVMTDGTQRGKITPKARSHFRRGLDNYLDEQQHMTHLSATVGAERRNVATFIKRWAMQTIVRESSAQYIMANLPEDESLWRASSQREVMSKANTLVRDLVEERLKQPDSPMSAAMEDVYAYARRRQGREGLSDAERDKLIDDGRERIVRQAMNGVYGVLAAIPRSQRETVSTPMMQMMSLSSEELLEAVRSRRSTSGSEVDELVDEARGVSVEEFSYKARSYFSRRTHHREQRDEYERAARDWEKARADGMAAPESHAMYEHYRVEAGYHSRAAQKYEEVLGAVVGESEWQRDWEKVSAYGDQYLALRMMRTDKSLARMKDEAMAEKYAQDLYGHPGGGSLTRTGAAGVAARSVIDSRIDDMAHTYAKMVDDLNAEVTSRGAHLRVAQQQDGEHETSTEITLRPRGEVSVYNLRRSQGPSPLTARGGLPQHMVGDDPHVIEHDEDEQVGYRSRLPLHRPGAQVELVRAPQYSRGETIGVDLHDVSEDIMADVPVGKRIRQKFTEMTAARRRALNKAKEYLQETSQTQEPLKEAEADITRAERTARMVQRTGRLVSQMVQRIERLRRYRQRDQLEAQPQPAPVESSQPVSEDVSIDVSSETTPVDTQQSEVTAPEPVRDQRQQQSDTVERTSALERYEPVATGRSFSLDDRMRTRITREVDAEVEEARSYFQNDGRDGRAPGDSGLGG